MYNHCSLWSWSRGSHCVARGNILQREQYFASLSIVTMDLKDPYYFFSFSTSICIKIDSRIRKNPNKPDSFFFSIWNPKKRQITFFGANLLYNYAWFPSRTLSIYDIVESQIWFVLKVLFNSNFTIFFFKNNISWLFL